MAKGKTVSKGDLVDAIAESANITKTDAKAALDGFLDEVTGQLKKGNKVQLTGFGTFEVRHRKARQGVKPSTGEKIKIPASNAPAFKAGASLKSAVN